MATTRITTASVSAAPSMSARTVLEGAFVDELALLQPTPGYMRLVKDRILHVWEQRRAEASERTTEQDRRVKVIQQKLDRPDEAFLYSESIDLTSYSRQRDKLREELTLAKIEHHTEAVDELVPWKRINWKKNLHCDLKGHGKDRTPHSSVDRD